VNLHYIPVHTQPYYQALGFKQGDFSESERYYAEAISLPMYPALTSQQQVHVADSLRKALRV
jgi:dTDP-4-amino-4,6-dideoxygalactose transaminase